MRWLSYCVVLAVCLAGFIGWHWHVPSEVTTEEVFRGDEAEQTERAINNFLAVVTKNQTDYVARGAHAKGHACVKAWFEVNTDLTTDFQHGIFSRPGIRYKSWIRFSNGASSVKANHDANRDARGMAIKLFRLRQDGLPLNNDESNTQDFLMHDHPVFFTEDIDDYNQFVESENKVLYFVASLNPFKWKLREMQHGLATLKEPPPSPLHNQYFSNTAYKLGPHNIKFSASACGTMTTPSPDRSDPDFLRKTMTRELTESASCFRFNVQQQNPDRLMPIEDPSVRWQEEESPFIPVATIRIPQQEIDSSEQQQFCENLSFSPWNNLPAHRPIGQLNRIRKQVYAAIARFRLEQNRQQVPTDLSW